MEREVSVKLLQDKLKLEQEQKAVAEDAKREQDILSRRAKEYSAALKQTKKGEQQVSTAVAQVPFLQRQVDEAQRQVAGLFDEKKKQQAAMEELRREVDIFINSFLKQEGLEKEKQEWLKALLEDIRQLEEELAEVGYEELQQRKALVR